MAMNDLELGSMSFSSFKMNLPVSKFLTAENSKREPPPRLPGARCRHTEGRPGRRGSEWFGQVQGVSLPDSPITSEPGSSFTTWPELVPFCQAQGLFLDLLPQTLGEQRLCPEVERLPL